MLLNEYSKLIHEIKKDYPLIRDLNEKFKEQLAAEKPPRSLAIMKHVPSDRWSLICWIDEKKGLFLEVLALRDPRDFTNWEFQKVDQFINRRTPNVREVLRKAQSEMRTKEYEEKEAEKEALDANKFIGRKLHDADNPVYQKPHLPLTLHRV